MLTRVTICAVALVLLVPVLSVSMPPSGMPPIDPDTTTRYLDQDTYFDINNILMFVYNTGNVAWDAAWILVKNHGFYYPFTGDVGDILDGTEDRTVVYAAGLWLSGKVGGDVRVAIAEMGWGNEWEFVPGPMSGGMPVPDDEAFRVYKIDKSSGVGRSGL